MTLFSAAILLGLLLGWLGGGSLERLGRRTVRLAWLVPLALAAQVFIALGVGTRVPPWVLPLHVGTDVLLLTVAAANWRLPGFSAMAIGLLMNATVIALNGGLMPQAPETLHVKHSGEDVAIGEHPARTKDVVLPREQTRVWWLGDVLPTPSWSPVQTVVSPGDLVVAAGLAAAVIGLMRPDRPVRPVRPLRLARQL